MAGSLLVNAPIAEGFVRLRKIHLVAVFMMPLSLLAAPAGATPGVSGGLTPSELAAVGPAEPPQKLYKAPDVGSRAEPTPEACVKVASQAKIKPSAGKSGRCASIRPATEKEFQAELKRDAAKKPDLLQWSDSSFAPSATFPVPAWPVTCTSTQGTELGWFTVSRRTACSHKVYYIEVIEIPTGRLIGTATVHNLVQTVVATDAVLIRGKAKWVVTNWTGVGLPERADGEGFGCFNGCGLTNYGVRQDNFDTWSSESDLDPFDKPASGQILDFPTESGITFFSSQWGLGQDGHHPYSVYINNDTTRTRCDWIQNAKAACIFFNHPGYVSWNHLKVPEFIRHIERAFNSGLPGSYLTETYLHRLMDDTKRNQNGNKACPGSIPRPNNMQCDEYPFRSAYEGAFTSGATQARSYPGCQMPDPARTGPTGWSRCFINAGQNGSAGGTLSAAYSSERILDGDRFQLGIGAHP